MGETIVNPSPLSNMPFGLIMVMTTVEKDDVDDVPKDSKFVSIPDAGWDDDEGIPPGPGQGESAPTRSMSMKSPW